MSFAEWQEDYSLGIKEIDKQHKTLILLINKLYRCHKQQKQCPDFESIIDELARYVDLHFSTEEKYFAQTNYPDRDLHIRKHEGFKKKINEFAHDYYSMNITEIEAVMNFLHTWYKQHILDIDAKYVKHLQEHLSSLR